MAGFDPKAAPEELATLIVELPDGVNLAAGEVGALGALLTGKVEERDPTKYAEVFRLASEKAISAWMRFACRVEEVNGRRRAKGADMVGLAAKLDEIARKANAELPNTPEKFGLMGLTLYNVALVGRGLRRYKEAAEAQRKSAGWYGLAGDRAKQLVGIFASQVEEVTAAFVDGGDSAIVRSIRALVAARDHTANAVSPYPKWMEDNASLHIAWAIMMARIAGNSLVSWVLLEEHRADFEAGKGSRFPHWARVFSAWDLFTAGNYRAVVGEVPLDLPSSSADNAALTIQILAALSARALGEVAKAEERLRAVAAHEGLDGGIPIAVAAHLFTK